jgi:hypothetical protein
MERTDDACYTDLSIPILQYLHRVLKSSQSVALAAPTGLTSYGKRVNDYYISNSAWKGLMGGRSLKYKQWGELTDS